MFFQEFFFLKESTECFDDGVGSTEVEAGLGEQLDYQIIPPELPNPFASEPRSAGSKVIFMTVLFSCLV